jgi:cellulose synthase/poly-beta-1,6-N-acetylglucosamine synthase-like glycosyltransferase
MLAPLVHGLTRLDWPAAKLDIKLILEAVDVDMIAQAHALNLPGNVEIVVVPELHPRTKPKALNYALPLVRGEYLVIFDAEDRPDRDQLRRAYAAFRRGLPNLACVQAALNIYNARATWLTRQFTLEYCALFDALLPALDKLRLPVPLGGTSNHFRMSALKWLMAWDPFNVTEDADLGMRLARSGYRCAMLSSTTYEEAPLRLSSWLRQRTRWLKGYVQTWLVHMRSPRKLWRELGPRGFLGFQTVIGGTILSALHRLSRVDGARILERARARLSPSSQGRAAEQLYWLLISAAAYRALWQFMTARFEWEKTDHGVAALRARFSTAEQDQL